MAWAVEITGISKSIDAQRLTSQKATLLGIGTQHYVKDVFYVNLNQNRRKIKVKGVYVMVYVDVINIYVHKYQVTFRELVDVQICDQVSHHCNAMTLAIWRST